jgi:FkbH-like protein
MKLIEALNILREEQPQDTQAFRLSLVCGFTPLHLATFLNAQLRLLLSGRRVELLSAGLYGDFLGNLEKAGESEADAIVMEWGDLDSRLGIRGLGSWAPKNLDDVIRNVRAQASKVRQAIEANSANKCVAVSLPTLPLPPVSFAPGWQASAFDLELRACISSLALELARVANVRIINPERLDRLSPLSERLDIKSELVSGFPYKLPHASTVAELLSRLVVPATPKKGLITDLDDTLWDGILGEVGTQGISWDLDHHSHMHGAYQRLLHAFAEAGVLIGVASKNDSAEVAKALERQDLILPASALFPVEAHWHPKSESVSRIIKAWNVGADSVVFIDDSPMELAEVKAVHPEVECILFPKDDPREIDDLFRGLRDLFGKSALSEEDAIRRESLRRAPAETLTDANHNGGGEEFLRQADAELTLSFSKDPVDPRALELINKTNQFNLNGKRHTESSWQHLLCEPDTILLVAAYRDKYGPLGKIAVLAGRKTKAKIQIDTWVMSCRAFSRRVEHRCIEELFDRFDVKEIEFDFQSTPKNGPVREFLAAMLGETPTGRCFLSRDQFSRHAGRTFHRVLEASHG